VANRTITVRGRGQASATPDGAAVSVAVRGQSESPREAHDDVANRLTIVEGLLDEHGIDRASWTTTLISIQEIDEWEGERPARSHRTTFQALAELEVFLTDTSRAGTLVAELVARAAAQVEGPWWRVVSTNPAWQEAWERAAADAGRKAQAIAAALGLSLGAILEVAESTGPERPRARTTGGGGFLALSAGAEIGIQAGGLEVAAAVDVTYELTQG